MADQGAEGVMGQLERDDGWDLSSQLREQRLGQMMLHDVAQPLSAACELLLQACEEGTGRWVVFQSRTFEE